MQRRKRYLFTIQSNLTNIVKSLILFVTPLDMREIIKEYIENCFSILHISSV